jgi:proteasome lid subunit RPN8/RPN11
MFACIVWTGETRSQLATATRQQAPREITAVLGGRIVGKTVHVERVVALPNQSMHNDAFVIEASQFARCEHDLRDAGLEFVGFAHSHPEGHAAPSQRDREQLWTDCVQVITNGEQVHAFVLDRDRVVHAVRQASQSMAAVTTSGATQ